MALQFIYEDEFGNTHLKAYARINYFSVTCGTHEMPIIDYSIEIYSHREARLNGKQPLFVMEDFFDYNNQPLDLTTIYNHVKQRSTFTKAIDIYEI